MSGSGGMLDSAHGPAHLLPGGMALRVAIARALACRPDIMLFHESAASIDVENQRVIRSMIRDVYTEKKVAIIFPLKSPWRRPDWERKSCVQRGQVPWAGELPVSWETGSDSG